MWKKLPSMSSSALDRICEFAPAQVGLAAFVWALVLLFLSAVIGVFEFTVRGRQVGYAVSLNWSFGFTLVAPFFYYFLLLAFQEAKDLPTKLAHAGLLRGADLEVHLNGAPVAATRWTTMRRKAAPWWLLISSFGLLESLWEWWVYSGSPLLLGQAPRENEIDWSVKFAGATGLDPKLSAGFSLLIFLQQAVLISMIGFLLWMALSFALWVQDLRRADRAVRLFPSPAFETKDDRRGFQLFSRFFQLFLLAGLCLYAHLLLSRLWNVYLHSTDESAKSIWEFVRDLFVEGFRHAADFKVHPGKLLDRISDLLHDFGALDFSGLYVALGAFLLFGISVTLLLVVLRGAADSGRRELLASGLRGTAKEKLEQMRLWPMTYPRLTTLLSLGFLGLTGMVAYRVAVLFLGVAAGLAMVAALREALRK